MRFGNFRLAAAAALLAATTLRAQVSVSTYHNDNARTGQNTQETTLTPANVNSGQFGKLFSVTVDGSVYAQPLYIANVNVAGSTRNVLYVATQHDSVYGIDADTGTVYWRHSLLPAGATPVNPVTDLGCHDIINEVGVTGTPVIDASTGTLYVVAKYKQNGTVLQALHALDLAAGSEKLGGPVQIQGSVPGTASDGDGTTVTFNPRQQNQRAALLLENGHLVIGWSSHCDNSPWHGWVMSYDAATLTQEAVYNPSANGMSAGIWMSGSGLAADSAGNLYAATGNGSWSASDRGDSILKLGAPANSALPLLDYFTPYDQASLTYNDNDVSAGGLILLPTLPSGRQLLVMVGKVGTLYLVDRNQMGRYCVDQTPACQGSDTNIVEEIPGIFTLYWGVPAYWNGSLYFGGGNADTGEAEPLKAYSFDANDSGLISKTPTSMSTKHFYFPGPDPSVSSNGGSNGIVWAMDNVHWSSQCSAGNSCQVLYAYDAGNLGHLLYTSAQAAKNRDVPGGAVKFTTPTIANGKVYVGSAGSVSAFGLLNAAAPPATAPTFSPAGGSYASAQAVAIADTTPGASVYYTLDGSNPTTASAHYSTPLVIRTTTTVKALATAGGYTNSSVSTATYTIGTSSQAPVALASVDNVNAIGNAGSPTTGGGIDGYGDDYAQNLIGSTVTWDGIVFNLGGADAADAASGANIALPSGNYATLNLLATGVHGNQPGQTFVVTYTDGTTTSIRQSLSDWHAPQNYPGESKAVTMAYRLTGSGATQSGPYYVYGYALAINAAKTVKSVTLPDNRDVVVLAVTLSGAAASGPPPSGPTPVALTPRANVYAVFDDGSPVTNGGLDGANDAYSESLLGSSVTWSGTTFIVGPAGIADAASGVTLSLPAGSFSSLKLLATASHGSQVNQRFTVTYADGTTTVITQSLSDWYEPQNFAGESAAVTLAYRLTPSGAPDNRTFYLYGYSLAIDPTKVLQSITLPVNSHVTVISMTAVP